MPHRHRLLVCSASPGKRYDRLHYSCGWPGYQALRPLMSPPSNNAADCRQHEYRAYRELPSVTPSPNHQALRVGRRCGKKTSGEMLTGGGQPALADFMDAKLHGLFHTLLLSRAMYKLLTVGPVQVGVAIVTSLKVGPAEVKSRHRRARPEQHFTSRPPASIDTGGAKPDR